MIVARWKWTDPDDGEVEHERIIRRDEFTLRHEVLSPGETEWRVVHDEESLMDHIEALHKEFGLP